MHIRAHLLSCLLVGALSMPTMSQTAWTRQSVGAAQDDLSGVIWTGTRFVAVGCVSGFGPGVIHASPDGKSWTKQSIPDVEKLQAVVWNGSRFVAVGSGGAILTSTDGIAWTLQRNDASHTEAMVSVTWTGSLFIAATWAGSIVTSPDGIAWTRRLGAGTEPRSLLNQVIWTGTQAVAVGGMGFNAADGVVYTSPDGLGWTKSLDAAEHGMLSVVWTGRKLVAVGGRFDSQGAPEPSPIASTSVNGIDWKAGPGTSKDYMQAVINAGDNLVAVGWDGTVLVSPDGVAWSRKSMGIPNRMFSLASDGKKLVAVGWGGVMTSPLDDGTSLLARNGEGMGLSVSSRDGMLTAGWSGAAGALTGAELYSLAGKKMLRLSKGAGPGTLVGPIGRLARGTYFLSAEGPGKRFTRMLEIMD